VESKTLVDEFLQNLVFHPTIQQLKLVDDKGISVAVHTYDVLKTSIKEIKKRYKTLDEAAKEIDMFVILVGVIIHDTTKATLRLKNNEISHSNLMRNYPAQVKKEAEKILKEVELATKVEILDEKFEKIVHIVLSHHGRWGKIVPNSKEDDIVHIADKYSATYHRINPIGAKKIIALMSKGYTKKQIIKITGQTESIINDRLKRSKVYLGLKNNQELLEYYYRNKTVPNGDHSFSRRIKETEALLKKVEKNGFEKLILDNELLEQCYKTKNFK
jgi:23S rRNA maturation-related 3'-5' exoribonuclease YhaM